jgi:prepilin-type N-terminal cleavage/methylation domain-containing protein
MRISGTGISSSHGFSFLELIVALFIISLVMAVVLPSFSGFGENKLKSESREMASILRYIYDSSAARKETFFMKFNLDTNQVSWEGPEGKKTRTFGDMTGVTTQSTGLISKGELIFFFEPLGTRENLAVHMSRGEKTMTITLNHLSGKVKIKDEDLKI